MYKKRDRKRHSRNSQTSLISQSIPNSFGSSRSSQNYRTLDHSMIYNHEHDPTKISTGQQKEIMTEIPRPPESIPSNTSLLNSLNIQFPKIPIPSLVKTRSVYTTSMTIASTVKSHAGSSPTTIAYQSANFEMGINNNPVGSLVSNNPEVNVQTLSRPGSWNVSCRFSLIV